MNEDSSFINALENISRVIMKYKVEAINSLNADISMSHFIYIEMINKLSEPTFSELAERLDITRPAVTVAINYLAEKGLAEKVQLDKDKRVFRVRLTSKGHDIVKVYKGAHQQFLQSVKSILSEQEYVQLVNLLKRIS